MKFYRFLLNPDGGDSSAPAQSSSAQSAATSSSSGQDSSASAQADGDASDSMLKGLLGLPASAPSSPSQPLPQTSQPAQPAQLDGNPLAAALKQRNQYPPRDLSDLDEEEADIFNNMSRKAFEKILPIYKEYKSQFLPNKEKFTKLPEMEKQLTALQQARWFDHPDSYQLSPDYQNTLDRLEQIGQIQSHFEAQLDAVEGGAKDFIMLQRGADGKLQQTKVPVDASTRRQLMTEILSAQQATKTLQDRANQVRTSHESRWTSHKTSMQALDNKLFGEYKEVLDAPAKAELAKFPEYFRNDVSAPLLAKAIVLLNMAGKALEAQQINRAGQQANQAASKLAPPSRSGVQPHQPAAPNGYSREEFEALRREGGF